MVLVDTSYSAMCPRAPMNSKEFINLVTKSNQAHGIENRMTQEIILLNKIEHL